MSHNASAARERTIGVGSLNRRANAAHTRQRSYRHWLDAVQQEAAERERWYEQHLNRGRAQGQDYGIEL